MSATNMLRAGVKIFELDKTRTVPSVATRNAAYCDIFAWGPVDEPTLMDSEDSLKEAFGKPTDANFKGWFNASNFLSEANGLYIKRIVPADAYNAIAGGSGAGLTLDITAVNGEVSSVAINAAGASYTIGDILEISGGVTLAEVRVTAVDAVGDVTNVVLLSNGTGYVTAVAVAMISRTNFLVKNDDEFTNNTLELPEILARYPGAFGNSLGITIMRASEFYGNQFEDRFQKAPTAIESFFDGDGITTNFTVSATIAADATKVVTMNNITMELGATPGTYSIVGSDVVIAGDNESFNGDDLTNQFTIANASALDVFSSVVVVDGTTLTAAYTGTGHVDPGYFDIDPVTGVMTIGTTLKTMSGDGVVDTWSVTTGDALTNLNTSVKVDGVAFTIVNVAPAVGEVEIATIAGGFSFTFEATETPAIGLNNIEVEWGYPVTGVSNVDVTYGLPLGTDSLKVFTEQTGVHAAVYDRDGKISGVSGTVVELFIDLSTDTEALFETGLSKYYVTHITDASEYVRISKAVTFFGDLILSNGSDGSALVSADYQNSYEAFRSAEDYDVTYVIDPVFDSALAIFLIKLSEDHTKAASFIGVPAAATVNNKGKELADTKAYANTLRSSSYGHLNPTWIYQYDRYNAKYRWIPTTGLDAGLYAKTHAENQMWTASAGYNRGQYRRALKISWLPNNSERDILSTEFINHVIRDRGAGFYLFSQFTMLREQSAFNRMNVRFLSIYVKRGLEDAFKYILFEINDEISRAAVRNLVNPYMRDIYAHRGIYEYAVKCDGENNSASVIDANELVCHVYMKPTRTIEKIGVFLVYTQTGIAFEEVQLTY